MTNLGTAWTPPWWWEVGPDGAGQVVEYIQFDPENARRLLDDLRAAVPTRTVHDGGQQYEVPVPPEEIEPAHLKAAAVELMLGEIEALVAGEPESETVLWERSLANTERHLDALQTPPGGGRSNNVALAEHLSEARERIEGIRFATAYGQSSAETEEERAWVLSVQSEAALNAFWLGWHMRAIDQKPFDEAARTGIKVRAGAKLGGQMARGVAPRTAEILDAMEKILTAQVAHGSARNVTHAAKRAYRRGHGTSALANAKLYNRHCKK